MLWQLKYNKFQFIYIYISAVKRLIASKLKGIVYIIYVCVQCIFIMPK